MYRSLKRKQISCILKIVLSDRKDEENMFSDNLSAAIRQVCASRKLSQEAAAELCDISVRHFGSIVRGKACPRISTLGKICDGLGLTPNDLLLPSELTVESSLSDSRPSASSAVNI